MKKLVVLLILPALLLGCPCAAQKQVAEEVKDSHRLILPKFTGYVDADDSLDADAKDDYRKLVDRLNAATDTLIKSLGD